MSSHEEKMKSCVGISSEHVCVCVCVSVVFYICCLAKKILKLTINNSYWLHFLSLRFLDFLQFLLLVSKSYLGLGSKQCDNSLEMFV